MTGLPLIIAFVAPVILMALGKVISSTTMVQYIIGIFIVSLFF